ncbi:transcriptional regulator [Klebsiella pneumoniae]|uniref:Transcriptional regulator n=1 Tax=Klebsiella pneumoniae TaxID=573 RepID=A0A377ZU54_KLEPN|nr:transcriptional regulator [Klebsiella pneumoniae]
MNTSDNHALGDFLRARRQRLDPATFGFPAGRRRTPGLRREEVAQLASISPPSREVLERIARGLRLTTPGARASVYSRLWPSAADASDGDG